MKKIILALLALCLSSQAMAQTASLDLVPRWSYGPTVAFTAIRQNDEGKYNNSFLTGGAGLQINCNFVDAQNFPWLGLGMPWMFGGNSADDSFRVSPGFVLTLVGNISVGATYDLFYSVNGDGFGLMTGNSSWQKNGTLLFAFTAPLGQNSAIYTLTK